MFLFGGLPQRKHCFGDLFTYEICKFSSFVFQNKPVAIFFLEAKTKNPTNSSSHPPLAGTLFPGSSTASTDKKKKEPLKRQGGFLLSRQEHQIIPAASYSIS